MYYYFIRAAILFIICLDLDKLYLLQGHWPQLLWSLWLSHVLLNHQSLVVMNKVQSNVLSMEALLTTLPHLMKSKRVFLFLLLIFHYFNILPSVYCIVNCIHTSTSLVYLGACQNTVSWLLSWLSHSFHFISVFSSNLKLNSSLFTDDEGSAEESEDSSSEIVRYEIKLKCTLNSL